MNTSQCKKLKIINNTMHNIFNDFIKRNETQPIMNIFNRPLNIDDEKLAEIEKIMEKKLKDKTRLKDDEIFQNPIMKITNLKKYANKIGIRNKYYSHYKKDNIYLLIIKIIIKLKNNSYSSNSSNSNSNNNNINSINSSNSISLYTVNSIKEDNKYLKDSIFLNEKFLEYTLNYNNVEKYKTEKYLSKDERKFKFIFENNKKINQEELATAEKNWLQTLVKEFKIHKPTNKKKPNMGKIGEDIIYHYFKKFKPHINTTDELGKNIKHPKEIFNSLDINFPVANSFCLETKPKNKKINGFKYDLEDDNNYYEIKTGSYYETGTAHEKIAGVPWKYINTFEACKKPLKVICLFVAEKWAKDIGLIETPNEQLSNNKIKLRDYINNILHIEFLGFSDILQKDLNIYKEGDKKLKNIIKS